jgi:hypothetical protein
MKGISRELDHATNGVQQEQKDLETGFLVVWIGDKMLR